MERRRVLETAGAGAAALYAGCTGDGGNAAPTDGSGTTDAADSTGSAAETSGTTTGAASGGDVLRVATYGPFVDAPSSSPGAWLKKRFESEFDATLKYQTPENELNYFIERKLQGAPIDADVYVGLNTDSLIRIDQKLSKPLFSPVEKGTLTRRDEVKGSIEFDPKERAVPYDTGYICLVYNETWGDGGFTAPETFEGLTKAEYEGDLITENPTSAATGQAFLLHTVKAQGRDGYLNYWKQLKQNGVRVLGTWSEAYNAYSGGEAPMVVSYSTDQVYAHREDSNMKKHQIRFLNDQGYANPEGMATFADTDRADLAHQFMDFVLRPEIQAGIAVRNVQFPATTTANLPKEYAKYAHEPPEPVTFTYEELKGNLSDWTDAWARQFASK